MGCCLSLEKKNIEVFQKEQFVQISPLSMNREKSTGSRGYEVIDHTILNLYRMSIVHSGTSSTKDSSVHKKKLSSNRNIDISRISSRDNLYRENHCNISY